MYEPAVVWHVVQDTLWLPVRGKYEVWLNVPCSQVASENLWHVSHVVGKPAATWFTGVVAVWYAARWHAEQGLVGTVR
jgi:hypothetical protein